MKLRFSQPSDQKEPTRAERVGDEGVTMKEVASEEESLCLV